MKNNQNEVNVNTVSVNIYFDDLKPETQEEILKIFDTTKAEENWDTFPLFIITREK